MWNSFFQPVSHFGTQPTTQFGNETRFNPKLRSWPGFKENFSLARSITLHEQKRLDFRWETFNLLNRTQFEPLSGGATLQNNNWGLWRAQANSQRRVQVSLKLYLVILSAQKGLSRGFSPWLDCRWEPLRRPILCLTCTSSSTDILQPDPLLH